MFKLTLKSLLDRKIRLALTAFAVVLGVAFVSGAFIIADSLRATFDDVADEIAGPVNVQVRGVEAFEGDINSRARVPASLVADIEAQPGVAEARGFIQGFPRVSVGEDFDTLIEAPQAPVLGFNYSDQVSSFELLEGTAPGPTEMLIDIDTAAEYELSIGDQARVRSLVPEETFTISGIVRFGEDNGAGAMFVLFETGTTQRLFGYDDAFMVIDIASENGVDQDALAAQLNAVLPDTAEAVTGEVVAEEFSDQFDEFITIFQNALLAFAVVALVVSAFIINNTFAIVLGQRIRELGLLRTLGASGSQVRRSVLIEAVIVGLIASLIGVLAGIGVAAGIKALIASAGDGAGLPDGPLIIAVRTWIAAFVVGLGVTLLSALAPAFRASSIPPIAALRDDNVLSAASGRRRTIIGLAFAILGGLLVFVGSTASGGAASQLGPLGLGAVLIFIAVAALSPLIARPVALVLGRPVAGVFNATGQLARQNAARNPQRTSSTAAALMVGLALVGTVLVIGNSFKATFSSLLDNSLRADLYIDLSGQSFIGFSPELVNELNALDEIDLAVGFRGGDQVAAMQVDGDRRWVWGTDAAALGTMVDVDLVSGSYDGLDDAGILVHQDPADDLDLRPGDTITAEFPVGGAKELTVVGIHQNGNFGNWIIDLSTFESSYDSMAQLDLFAAANIADGVDEATARAAADAVAERYPEANLQNRDEFQETLEGRIDQLLITVNILLLFAIIIAVLGIINTMMLSVFERTREIGLLRAVGMTRAQTRRMIRWEAVIVSIFGGLLGLVLGTVLGLVAISAMPDSIITDTAIPWTSFVVIVVLCMFVGMFAALFPGVRASRLNVLDAIAHN